MEKHLLILTLLSISSYIYLKLAIKFKIIDKPNERSSHSKITVRGGGIIFSIAMLLFSVLNNFEYPYFTMGVILISLVSFLDDIYTLSSKIRFPFQLLAVFLVLYQIGLPFIPMYIFGFALIFGVGLINMFNFMDGINGITGLYSISVLLGLYGINANEHLIDSDLIVYALISLIVFGFYNFRKKALLFAGDIGSIAIGMLIFFIGLYFTYTLESPLIAATVIVYGADAAYTLLYRLLFTKESVLAPHRLHIYQKLVHVKKIGHLKVSLSYAVLQIVINVIVFKSYHLPIKTQMIIFLSLSIFFTGLYVLLFRKLKK
ncbi:MAG: glycosyltransferase family 4 protein [Polaribacter sp.]|uniref:MraY family glycosyltransferase n=1 Tax=Polaribacter sp. TaxID=1920175 RepID=UPI003BAF5251